MPQDSRATSLCHGKSNRVKNAMMSNSACQSYLRSLLKLKTPCSQWPRKGTKSPPAPLERDRLVLSCFFVFFVAISYLPHSMRAQFAFITVGAAENC